MIYNERRQLEPAGFHGEPPLLSAHIYDPETRLSTFLNPDTRIARAMTLPENPRATAGSVPAIGQEEGQDIGTETVAGLLLHGTRKERVVVARASGTGANITITDDYWYSEDLKIYLVIRHNDPRTGEQIVGVSEVERGEPDPGNFVIPSRYKVVDETLVPEDRP